MGKPWTVFGRAVTVFGAHFLADHSLFSSFAIMGCGERQRLQSDKRLRESFFFFLPPFSPYIIHGGLFKKFGCQILTMAFI